jgi:DNA-binding Lrp family transcriptional regulator
MKMGFGMQLRSLLVLALLVIVPSSCDGNGQLSLTDYVERVNTMTADGRAQAERLYVDYRALAAPTVDDLATMLDQVLAIRVEVHKELVDLGEPPDQIAELHAAIVDWHAAAIDVERALATRAGQVSSWEELERSAELEAYKVMGAEGLMVCRELQAKLDATEARVVFADTPWIPGEMKEVVDAVLGCTPIGE